MSPHPRFPHAWFAFLVMLGTTPLFAQAARIDPISAPHLGERAEFRIAGAPSSENNFDPDLIQIDGTFTSPSGVKATVPAFWFQDYTRALVNGAEVLTARGAAEWRLRYTPIEPGEYQLALTISLRRAPAGPAATSTFSVAPGSGAPRSGWARLAPDRRALETSDGHALRLIGENVCWAHERGTYDYDDWFAGMQQSGQNFARLWMAPWWAGLEHTPGTLNRYKLDAAWQLDRIFELAEAKGLFLMLCFDHHGMYLANDAAWAGSNNFWPTNPYAKENGGPCVSPNDFFTNPTAREIYQKRLRYLIARYGYSPQLLAWQFFNEIDNAYVPRSNLVAADVAAWHHVMGGWLRSHDPYHHLVTTSLTGGSDRREIWSVPELDFSMYHSYSDPAPGRKVAALSADFLQRYGKPVMIGEFGVSARDWARPADPHLRGFRQALWGGALGGSVGTSMSWWWEDIHVDRAYTLYSALHDILNRAGWSSGAWSLLDASAPTTPPAELGEPIKDGAIFNAALGLNSFRRILLASEAAIANPLAAERSSEFLSGFLRGSRNADQQRPLRTIAWFADKAKLVFHVDSVASEAELVVRIDGQEVTREKLGSSEPVAARQTRKIDHEYTVPVPAGKHRVEIANEGADWASLDSVRLDRVRPSEFAGNWQYTPEIVGLRQQSKAVVYLYSPYLAFPAGQHRYDAPLLTGQTVTLRNWPAGKFRAEWFDPQTARGLGTTEATAMNGELRVPVPEFSQDLAAIITATEPAE